MSTPGKERRTPARIVDISVGGIGLILKERFEEGTQLVVRLQTTAITRPLPVKVVHLVEIAPESKRPRKPKMNAKVPRD